MIFELNSFHLGIFGIVQSNTASTGKAFFWGGGGGGEMN